MGNQNGSFSLHTPSRQARKRRLKKDAQSIYSLEIPSFDEATGTLGSEYIFPRSLAVEVAIENVLRQERGELRTKASGVGILRFLAEFQESREIIYVYFWYIIAHIRRVHAEKTLIGRYVNLERIIRGAFPRYKAELPPIDQLERILAKSAHSAAKFAKDSSTTLLQAEVTDELPPLVPTVANLPSHHEGNTSVSDGARTLRHEFGAILGEDGARASHGTQRKRKSTQQPSRNSISHISVMEAASEKSLQQDPAILWRCTEAIKAFNVVKLEVFELAEFAQRCFHRLAALFGQAFERLAEGKDEVLTAFTFIVPHVVHYGFVYCFPNDVVAGLFNAVMRVNLYRIFYFWCSGLVATYVRVNGWPRPPTAEKGGMLKGGDQCAATPSVSESTLLLTTSLTLKLSGSPLDARGEVSSPSLIRLLENSANPLAPIAAGGEQVQALDDDSFEDVDVEVANGHHRLMLEFNRYAKHVNYLLHELAERTEGMHRELACGSTLAPPTEAGNNSVREADALERVGSQLPPAGKRSPPPSSTAPLAEGLMKGKLQESFQAPKGLPLQEPSRRHTAAAAAGDNAETELPVIPQTIRAVKTRKLPATTGVCVLSGFPLNRTAPHVKQYILQPTEELLVEVPLPPLDDDLSTEGADGTERRSSLADGRPTSLALRTVKVPLPLTSPFFQCYAGERLGANVAGTSNTPAAKLTTLGASGSFSPRGPFCPAGNAQNGMTAHVAAATTSPTVAQTVTTTTRMPSIPQKHNLSTNNNNNNNNNNKLKTLVLPHSTQKAINVMLIPPSNAHLRPLQFKDLTKEVTQRQLALERQMDRLSEREQFLRRQYVAESQQGTRRVHTLLAECQSDRLEVEAYRGLFNKRARKENIMRRKKQLRLEAIKS
ncbi:uncharacterized protein Tco025E_00298 [Trypanosoma conorhini]|uniref:Uncharacterized protein n=1 Tax=Trypanosoma conorhini TaxID=83891 RepID=A0A422QC00_9TRYP|nr:uncharacterized protein Tco025E_00298 [Trypanosoma conorhini]RNF27436.1 hypothetical protein Tco025E_00298 [Trypanosoma conorhini]